MFGNTIPPPLLSIFSSTSSDPLCLFSTKVDLDLPEDSGIILVKDSDDQRVDIPANDATILSRDPKKFKLRGGGRGGGVGGGDEDEVEAVRRRGLLSKDPVLHIQSPTISSTYVKTLGRALELELPYLHFQFRTLGGRPLMFEVGVQDVSGRVGRIRVSNFQARPCLYLERKGGGKEPGVSKSGGNQDEGRERGNLLGGKGRRSKGPILHLPLALPNSPEKDENVLTRWCSLSLPLAHIMPQFNNPNLLSLKSARALAGERHGSTREEDGPGGGKRGEDVADSEGERNGEGEAREDGESLVEVSFQTFDRFKSISFVKVHANVRLRRIWATDRPDPTLGTRIDELEVFAAET
ncbi:hypothetical protein IE53DRAFT_384876 [Violaceomyces palustris]|uniref:Uncharacterized protein n=1 Tax=Violaceomyces palustris TaxID=1673888 RepID=A0ACD0P3N3_9BASI|nr:hypothetical protein IE53DRAFT_384876 [Violaceomyces palustris]